MDSEIEMRIANHRVGVSATKVFVYIAGPMRGYVEHNFPAFRAAEERWNNAGFVVASPREIGESLFGNDVTVSPTEYLRADMRALSVCDAIALLPHWEDSTGARCEVAAAITFGLKFFDALTLTEMPVPSHVVIAGGYERPRGPVSVLQMLAQETNAINRANGWDVLTTEDWLDAKKLLASLALVHSEVSEAVEAVREDDTDHFELELADVLIRCLDIAGGLEIDIETAIRDKLAVNRSRGFHHGGKKRI